ncbi:cell wall anchor protein [Neorhizobium sp. P12A]|uniref:cell wall anchor protein n=1 Tax=Neorhizobium sp. P12A TaxID=2268027 RepID=UPI0011F08480|nr:cell wall anchor protein [Neorhizobium sp. P12A]KAA0697406.1 cell wall anchor protein [Neorhizobium sp. P12A]
MRLMLIACTLGIALSSCTTTETTKIDDAIQQNLPKVCSALSIAHSAFTAVAASGAVKSSTVAKEAAAYAGVSVICSDPAHTNVVNAVVLVAQAYATVSAALVEAKTAH